LRFSGSTDYEAEALTTIDPFKTKHLLGSFIINMPFIGRKYKK